MAKFKSFTAARDFNFSQYILITFCTIFCRDSHHKGIMNFYFHLGTHIEQVTFCTIFRRDSHHKGIMNFYFHLGTHI